MKPLSNKKVDNVFWEMVILNCDHVFEWLLQCGEVGCDKCYITYDIWINEYAQKK